MKIERINSKPKFVMTMSYDEVEQIHDELSDVGSLAMTKSPALHHLFLVTLDALVR